MNFLRFPRESGLRAPRSVRTWNFLDYFSEFVSGSHRVRQFAEASERISTFLHVKVDSDVPAQFAPWKSGRCLHLQSYGGGRVFSTVLTHFSRSSRSSGVDRQFSEPSMAKSSLPSRAPAQ